MAIDNSMNVGIHPWCNLECIAYDGDKIRPSQLRWGGRMPAPGTASAAVRRHVMGVTASIQATASLTIVI
jgi:hypothetical protein